jgi:formylglycine-generating enzyme required for sulfatase activity
MSRVAGARAQRPGEPLQILRWRSRSQAFVEDIDGLKLTMLKIPAGSFLMGSPQGEEGRSDDEGPQHRVELTEFLMGQTPITQAQWRVVAGWQPPDGESWGRKLELNPSRFRGGNNQEGGEARLFDGEANTDQRPVEQVSWEDAIEFCKRLSKRTGRNYSLPCEAQWEYACRAGSSTPFHFGETISPELANYDGRRTYGDGPSGEYRGQTRPVGMFSANASDVKPFPANAWGLYDMHGNVWELCLDQWHPNYDPDRVPKDGSAWVEVDVKQVDVKDDRFIRRLLRGGSWGNLPGAAARPAAAIPGPAKSTTSSVCVWSASPRAVLLSS